jgi:hypothetical protein
MRLNSDLLLSIEKSISREMTWNVPQIQIQSCLNETTRPREILFKEVRVVKPGRRVGVRPVQKVWVCGKSSLSHESVFQKGGWRLRRD